MDFLNSKLFRRSEKILWLALIFLFQWPHPASAFKSFSSGEFYHKTITHQGLKGISTEVGPANPKKSISFSDTTILDVQKAVRDVDSEHLLGTSGDRESKDGESHCDNEKLLDCSARILKLRKDIIETLTTQSLPDNAGPIVWNILGKALHTVQDYYSHANWVERGNDTQINEYLLGDRGKAGGLLPPKELPPKPNAAVAPACQPKSGGGSEILNLGNYPTSGFWLRGNICDVTSAHPGRCVHGCTGPLCEQASDSTCPGMNKDTPDELGEHAQSRHQIAASLAIKATAEFVTQIINEVQSQQGIDQGQKDQAMCALMGSHACTSALSIIPGAVGPGMITPAGSGPNRSGGAVIHVTTLADSGPGSLREAVETSGPRTLVFDVSGYIELQSVIRITEPFVTIAGQTAPFPGIALKGAGVEIRTHDVLVQHIRIRVGDDPNGPNPEGRDGLTILGSNSGGEVSYIVIDHVSMSWAIDENMGTWVGGIHDITVRNSVLSEGLWHSIHPDGPHSMGLLVGPGARNFLVVGNLFAHNDQRNMRVSGNTDTLFVNNVVYNWRKYSGVYGSDVGSLDASLVGNVYIRGLDTVQGDLPIIMESSLVAGSKVFLDDNEAVQRTDDLWSIADNNATDSIKAGMPPNWPSSLTAQKGNVVKNWVLNNVGARRADGNPVDLRIIDDVLNGTGRIIDSQDDVGGWPTLIENVRGTGGIPALSVPSNAIQPSGYTELEEWLHRLARQIENPK